MVVAVYKEDVDKSTCQIVPSGAGRVAKCSQLGDRGDGGVDAGASWWSHATQNNCAPRSSGPWCLGLVENESSVVCYREPIIVAHEDFPEMANGLLPCEYGEAKAHIGDSSDLCCCWRIALCAFNIMGYAITISNTISNNAI